MMASHLVALLTLAACASAALGEDVVSEANGFLSTTPATTTRLSKYYNDLVESLPSQHGKCVAITGTTSGLGYMAALATAKKNPSCLILLNRASSRAVRAEADVKKLAGVGVAVVTVTCDLSNISSVREAADSVNIFAAEFGGLDVLALNAGIMAQPDVRTADGFDVTMQTNHLSHFLLTKLLMPSLQAAAARRGEVRIVTQSSLARAGGPPNEAYYMKSPAGSLGGDADSGMERYHQSKLANIVFAMALHSKFAKAPTYSNFKALSAAPGIAATDLHFPIPTLPNAMMKFMQNHLIMSAADGSCSLLTAMYASSAKSGDFYEPRWLFSGGPLQVIDEGVPGKFAALPRSLIGVKDMLSCSDAVGAKVWSASEEGLGEKFVISGMPLVLAESSVAPRVRANSALLGDAASGHGPFVAEVVYMQGAVYVLRVKLPVEAGAGKDIKHDATQAVKLPDGLAWDVVVRSGRVEPSLAAESEWQNYNAVMPDGSQADFRDGWLEFFYNPKKSGQQTMQEMKDAIVAEGHRCCCEGEECKWYPREALIGHTPDSHCPRLWAEERGLVAQRCASSRQCLFSHKCSQTHHASDDSQCQITRDPSAFFTGLAESDPMCSDVRGWDR